MHGLIAPQSCRATLDPDEMEYEQEAAPPHPCSDPEPEHNPFWRASDTDWNAFNEMYPRGPHPFFISHEQDEIDRIQDQIDLEHANWEPAY